MPIHEYQCTGCHHKFDLLQKMNDEPAKKCPECSKDTLVRLVSAAAFQLKGTGWYATDFKNKGKPAQKTEDKPSSSDATKVEKKTTESTPATTVTKKGDSE